MSNPTFRKKKLISNKKQLSWTLQKLTQHSFQNDIGN